MAGFVFGYEGDVFYASVTYIIIHQSRLIPGGPVASSKWRKSMVITISSGLVRIFAPTSPSARMENPKLSAPGYC